MGYARDYAVPLISAVFLFAAFACGIFFSGFDKYYFAPAIILVAAIAGLAMLPGFKKGWAFANAPAALFLLGFWLWMAVSLLWSRVPNVSMIFCLTIGSLPLLFFALTQSENSDRILAACRIALLAAVSLLAGWACIQFVFLSDLAGTRIHHPMLNANNMAVVIAVNMFLLLPLYARARGVRQFFYGFMIAVFLLAVLATQSRGGLLGLGLGAFAFALLNRAQIRQRWQPFVTLAVALGLDVLFFFVMIHQRVSVLHISGGGDAEASNQNRLYLWKAGIRMLADHPFRGAGLGTFYLTYPPYRLFGDTSDGYFLHMDPLQFAIEMGLPALLLFYGFAAAVFVRTINAVRQQASTASARIELAGAFGGLLVLLVNTHLNFDLYMLPALLLAAILLCLWYRATENMIGPARVNLRLANPRHMWFLVPVYALVFVIGPVWVARAGLAVQQDGLSAQALQAGDFDAASAYAANALRYGPANYDRAYLIDTLWRGQILQQQFLTLDAGQRDSLYHDAMALLDRTLRYNPYNIQALNYKALLSFIAYPRIDVDGIDNAKTYLEQALAIDPVNFDIRIGLAKLAQMQGRTQDVIRILEDGKRYDITGFYVSNVYYTLLADAKRQSGDAAAADEILRPLQEREATMRESQAKQNSLDQWVNQKIGELLKR